MESEFCEVETAATALKVEIPPKIGWDRQSSLFGGGFGVIQNTQIGGC